MSLHTDALELLATLKKVIVALQHFDHPSGAPYAKDIAALLEPTVDDFEQAIIQTRSKTDAIKVLDEIGPLMENVNGAATKGDLMIFTDGDEVLNAYWRLNTIFRESRYADESL